MEAGPFSACPLCDTPLGVPEETGDGEVTWFKVDDKLHSHAKVMELGDDDSDAMALWVLAGSWASDQLTDGWIPRSAARRLDTHYERRARALVRVGLWEEDVRNGVAGWVFHGWNKPGRQPTSEQVQKERADKSARQQRWRENKRNGNGQFTVDGDVDASTHRLHVDRVDGDVVPAPTRPDPTRPVLPTEVRKSTPASNAEGSRPTPEGFDAFWRAYPKRVDKKYAERCYAKALTKVSADVLIAQAQFYAMEQALTEKEFIKNPGTWLNRECWTNEPMSPPPPPLDANEAATLPPLGSAITPADPYGGDRHMARQAPRYASPPKPSTTDQRVAEGLRLAAYYEARGE